LFTHFTKISGTLVKQTSLSPPHNVRKETFAGRRIPFITKGIQLEKKGIPFTTKGIRLETKGIHFMTKGIQ
jgi:hypothetical protein